VDPHSQPSLCSCRSLGLSPLRSNVKELLYTWTDVKYCIIVSFSLITSLLHLVVYHLASAWLCHLFLSLSFRIYIICYQYFYHVVFCIILVFVPLYHMVFLLSLV
jgi:hypothetical protein